MTVVTIDELEYDLDNLSDEAKAQLFSLQAVDRRIAAAQEELAILQTARMAYGKALKELLPLTSASGTDKIQWPN
jgi:hypothetical protein